MHRIGKNVSTTSEAPVAYHRTVVVTMERILAIHGRDALAQIEEAHPDLIVMDLMMPVMGGVELYRQLKQRTETRSLPIILMSAGLAPPNELLDGDTLSPSRST
jgi:CheY-like chemotaxis protein